MGADFCLGERSHTPMHQLADIADTFPASKCKNPHAPSKCNLPQRKIKATPGKSRIMRIMHYITQTWGFSHYAENCYALELLRYFINGTKTRKEQSLRIKGTKRGVRDPTAQHRDAAPSAPRSRSWCPTAPAGPAGRVPGAICSIPGLSEAVHRVNGQMI